MLGFSEYETLFNSLLRIYRNHLLYEESLKLAHVFVADYIESGCKIEIGDNKKNLDRCIKITHKVDQLSRAYLDGKTPNLDPIFTRIIEYYITIGDLLSARQYNERLVDRTLARTLNDRIQNIEANRSGQVASKSLKEQESRIFAEKLSHLQNFARDQRIIYDNMLRVRTSLKKRYFQKPIDYILATDLPAAANSYFDVTLELIKIRKYELAGITASMNQLILLYLNEHAKMKETFGKLDQSLGISKSIFHETFPIRIIDFILQMIEAQLKDQMKQGLKLFEWVPLFPEERIIVDVLLTDQPDLKERINHIKEGSQTSEIEANINYRVHLGKLTLDPGLLSKRQSYESRYWAISFWKHPSCSNTYVKIFAAFSFTRIAYALSNSGDRRFLGK